MPVALDAAFFNTSSIFDDVVFPFVAASKQPPNKSLHATRRSVFL
jgi:hypothetical protein